MEMEIPNSFEEDPKEAIRRQMIDYKLEQLEKETDVNVLTQRENLDSLVGLPEPSTARSAMKGHRPKSTTRQKESDYNRPNTAR